MDETERDKEERRSANRVLAVLATIAAVIWGCRIYRVKDELGPTEKPFAETSIEGVIEKPELDPILEAIVASGDDDFIRNMARKMEEERPDKAFDLYRTLGDKDSMARLAIGNFHKDSPLWLSEELAEKAGLKLTPELYNKRGDYHFEQSEFVTAYHAYKKADNEEGIRRTALEMEKSSHDRKTAFGAYLYLKDKDSAYRVAKGAFIQSHYMEGADDSLLRKLGKKPTKELWKLRGDWLFALSSTEYKDDAVRKRITLSSASQCYQRAGAPEQVREVADLYLATFTGKPAAD